MRMPMKIHTNPILTFIRSYSCGNCSFSYALTYDWWPPPFNRTFSLRVDSQSRLQNFHFNVYRFHQSGDSDWIQAASIGLTSTSIPVKILEWIVISEWPHTKHLLCQLYHGLFFVEVWYKSLRYWQLHSWRKEFWFLNFEDNQLRMRSKLLLWYRWCHL